MHSSQCCCCFCYDFGRAVDAECQERSKLFVVDRKILCCLSTVSCKPPANSPMNNRDCFYVHSVLFIFRNAPQSPKQKLQHSHFGILSLSDTCTAHTHTLSLPHSLLFLRMWDEGSDKKKNTLTPPYRPVPPFPYVPESGSGSHCSLLAQEKEIFGPVFNSLQIAPETTINIFLHRPPSI